eukprot:CAMPEP_0197835830 /NCGR_PEP_ID=MMETSP1437-20131217/27079_1 /TAXON_ID=49252 ORGANISM="Eucampia antarctica, Strain CCMP1452" /NCGR_SAMPLE_ID=MMETSP1437 /ASSEMBLY_ACC=CAM_ASM_001096 /LENGTH=303 /DNA_ID=CAMNT_0043441539 /DNA_START=48 /DNA_END=959 /DNA_ORIENTATION=-
MTRFLFVLVIASSLCVWGEARSSSRAAWGVARIPRGGSSEDYAVACESVKAGIIEKASMSIDEMRQSIVEEGEVISDFGAKAESICNQAVEGFALSAPDAGEDTSAASVYDQMLETLEATLDAPLHVLYLQQLSLLRERALQNYRAASRVTETSDYEAMLQSDGQFTREAEASTREGSDWSFSAERTHLQSIMNDIAQTRKKLIDVQLKHSEKYSTAMTFLQSQQQMIGQLQQQLYGQSSPWNVGWAYRVPDTNFNVQGSYQQGRANVQVSCVADEYAPMLGPNGFTNGVGPGNLGLSLNLSV